MGTNWTTEQAAVIDHRNGNLLVAAAAGSGKTAVLSERILAVLTDEKNPVNIDELLVVTFTRAAAAEMKERIGKKIAEYIQNNPDNRHMQRQSALVHNASITTIDSFCLQVVREFFHVIDMDPAFRIGDDAEMAILKSDILEELLEEKYAEGDRAFLNYIDCYSSGRTDEAVEGQILSLYEASQSNPRPEEWLENSVKKGCFESVEEFDESDIAKKIVSQTLAQIRECIESINLALEICREPEGPIQYEETFEKEGLMFRNALAVTGFDELNKAINGFTFETLSRKKNNDADKKEAAKNIRDDYKKKLTKIRENYFADSTEKLIELQNKSMQAVACLVELTLDFSARFMAAKLEKGIFSFNDIEHFALNILEHKQEDGSAPAADALRERYAEIIVDEYQDSNLLQESILTSISRESLKSPEYPDGQPNMFMVGDVKQSIYRFRRARPDLFMEKYDKYSAPGLYKQIMLRKNFISRYEVLDAANVVFEWCMHKDFGRVEYDADAALYTGNLEYQPVESGLFNPELIIVGGAEDEENSLDDTQYKEAYAVAKRIRRLMSPKSDFRITKGGELCKPSYSDFAILLRSTSGWVEMFTRVLSDMGIPVRSEGKTGFFDAGEVKTALNYLKCLDNPKQDIPFVSLLYSPILRMSNDELANLLVKHEFVYDTLCRVVAGEDIPEGLSLERLEKLKDFMTTFEYFRKRKRVLSISNLIDEFYRVTGFYKLVRALPAGERRAANLDFLREQALKFEKSSYSGLFNFVRYVENLKDHEIDFSEASLEGGGDAVRIMTTHGSKGLEFPVVIIPQLFKGFNDMDSKATLVIHPELGPALNYVDLESRRKISSFRKKYVANDLKRENIAEELRVFYVAMTRAKEKLILLGAASDKELNKLAEIQGGEKIKLSDISSASSYFDFIKGGILGKALGKSLVVGAAPLPVECKSKATGNTVTWEVSLEVGKQMPLEEYRDLMADSAAESLAESLLFGSKPAANAKSQALKKALSYQYPYEKLTTEPLKHSVSELKHKAMAALLEDPEDGAEQAEWIKTGKQESKTGVHTGAEYGTAMHRAMELMPFGSIKTEGDVKAYIEKALEENLLEEETLELVNIKKIFAFTSTKAYEAMSAAAGKGLLFREQPFVYGLPAEGGSEEDINLIQGVIDVYYETEEGISVLDYKTDHAEPEEIKKRYTTQLALYAGALEQITGKKVIEKLIYSFSNEVEIKL